ncbi:acyltransferase family protein [Chryseobacterium polytrichastri]|uniref:Peptidoglycan/LPS O-acetylase OafA/YrhL, contains acyltransferase and SGNH-hydrolase domains n=1 Tax=Chryseobacterium polytrichastri TaxID=1302687 RepID=A0A1M6WLR1_9FLAO|nr:acyltransferase [Chryseobacterium polytrichastri]SHK94700.1 Peptidoglycan/LPS O-acetylase OafA/YrhL, contains acyltransferase and SGNH-hydrolase domains [Chryseobacterium polytrichastri]
MNNALNISQSRPHYEILDGLRGVAAIMVIFFHVFETFSNGDHTKQFINHGYLAVDFFFMLSGYVISYAYDNRWSQMTLKDFFIRRLVRLQPMIIIGSLVGAVLFYFQYSEGLGWGGISTTPVWKLLLVMFIGMTVIPVGKGLDIRGWNEMHPLNGPAWSLFYEYMANIVYALFLRKVSKFVLGILVFIAAAITIHYAFTNPHGDIIGGWSIDDATQMRIGFTRLSFPFLMGILLARVGKLKYTKNAFLTTSILLIILFAFPRLGGNTAPWKNAFYECFTLMILFPIVILLGAGGKVVGEKANQFCKFLGDISYPIYITHFPLVYVYMAWVTNGKHTLEEPISWILGFVTVIISIIMAYVFMRFYDIPVRKWLSKKIISK